MTANNFKIAFRILGRKKANTLMNVLGISIGLACFMLISLYVKQEVTYDGFHSKKDDIYRAWVKEIYTDGRVFWDIATPLPLGPTLGENIPEVEEFVQISSRPTLVGRGEGRIADQLDIVTSNFFEVFDFQIVSGNSQDPLGERTNAVLTQSYARKYFGDNDPIGETISVQIGSEIRDFIVSAVSEDPPLNTNVPFNLAISMENKDILFSPGALNAWFSINPETYVLLREGTNPEDLSPKTKVMIKSVLDGTNTFGDVPVEDHYVVGFQPITSIHLDDEVPSGRVAVGNPQYVYILGAIGLLVLVIACINYTTLSIGQSFKRSKEVGMRKVVGAESNTLVWQYLTESTVVALLSMIFGVLFTFLMLPIFNDLAQTSLVIPVNLESIVVVLVLVAAIGLLSGIYPALILSKLKVINVLRGTTQSVFNRQMIRRGMVVFQFLLTVFLISSTLIMRKQLVYLQNQDLGFNQDAMISVPLYAKDGSTRLSQQITTAMENGESLIGELSRNPQLTDFAMGSHVFGTPGWVQLGFDANTGTYLTFNLLIVDPNYLDAFEIEMAQGRSYDGSLASDKERGVVLNETAAEYFGVSEDPIGKKLPGDEFGDHQIIGVAKDFNFESLHSEIRPLVIVQNPIPIFMGINDFNSNDTVVPKLVFRYHGASLLAVENALSPAWSKIFPDEELNFSFVEERLQNQYQNEARVNKIVSIATALSILIASLGLLGLAILVVNTKVKEIGIRKVLGASPRIIFSLLFRGFSLQLLLAAILSVPITIYLMNQWLDDFQYRISIGVEMFVFSGVLSLTIMLLVVGYHVINAARANPVRALRTE